VFAGEDVRSSPGDDLRLCFGSCLILTSWHKYTGATPYIDLKININTLNSIVKGTGSQCNRYGIGVL